MILLRYELTGCFMLLVGRNGAVERLCPVGMVDELCGDQNESPETTLDICKSLKKSKRSYRLVRAELDIKLAWTSSWVLLQSMPVL